MEYFFHIVTPQFYPVVGGSEKSVERIAILLKSIFNDSESAIYVLDTSNPNDNYSVSDIKINYLRDKKDFVLAPLIAIDGDFLNIITNKKNSNRHIFKIDYFTLKSEIESCINYYPEHKHIIVSFYITNSGYVAQHVANNLNISHITSIRGSDFSLNFYNPNYYQSYDFVLKSVDYIVTTSKEQENALLKVFPAISSKISTVYNSIQNIHQLPLWKNSKRDRIKIVCDTGFSLKKGTHILLESIANLFNSGYKISFEIAGAIEDHEFKYWQSIITEFESKYSYFKYHNYIREIRNFIYDGDIYCSATLGEGCSNARIFSFCIGIPMVTTSVGEMAHLGKNSENVILVPPIEPNLFTNSLLTLIDRIQSDKMQIDSSIILARRNQFTENTEKYAWKNIIEKLF